VVAGRIETISVTPVPAFYRGELGKSSGSDNIGKSCLEWLVRARTNSGVEGLTVANAYMREFTDFHHSEGTVKGLLEVLEEVFLGRRTDGFLEISDGRVVAIKSEVARAFRHNGWMSILAFDLLGREKGVSCIELLGGRQRDRIPAYDATLFFQEFLHPETGPAQVARDASESHRAGYRQLKINIGRGRRWMLPADGLRRDVEVVLAVREALGEDAEIMVDAGRGYDGNLDLLDDFVRETLKARILWMEDLITPDVTGYRALRRIQERTGCNAWLVCGKDDTHPISPIFQDLADEGLIDGYRPDIASAGFATWQRIEDGLRDTNVRSLPSSFANGCFGARAGVVFGAASRRFAGVEDERFLPNVYKVDSSIFDDGSYTLPDGPGLGLEIDLEKYERVYAAHEAVVRAGDRRVP
jgi:D-galactarolactone cycloisomerase